MKKPWVLSYPLSAQRRLWSDWVDAQADLNLRWRYSHFVGYVMSRLICCFFLKFALWSYMKCFDKTISALARHCFHLRMNARCIALQKQRLNRLNQTESAVFKLWMLYFQRISFQIDSWHFGHNLINIRKKRVQNFYGAFPLRWFEDFTSSKEPRKVCSRIS